jgi:uncharacterized BrkB/YihY/UPF0761 family membrane protein
MRRALGPAPRFLRSAARLLASAGREWSNDNAPRLGASLSYCTIFALAPLLLIVVAVAGLALGAEAAQGKIVEQLAGHRFDDDSRGPTRHAFLSTEGTAGIEPCA